MTSKGPRSYLTLILADALLFLLNNSVKLLTSFSHNKITASHTVTFQIFDFHDHINGNQSSQYSIDSAIPVLGIYPKKWKSGFRVDSHSIFIAASFTTAKTRKQPMFING